MIMVMMSCRSTVDDSHQNVVKDKSFRIKHDDIHFFSRLLSRHEPTIPNNNNSSRSFRVYYADVSVPFVWESQPGTPKHRLSGAGNAALRPPLTPPPSYYTNKTPPKKELSASSNLLRTLLVKVGSLKRAKSSSSSSSAAAAAPSSPSPSFTHSPSFSSCSSSSPSSFSASATPSSFHGRRRRRASSGSASSYDKSIEEISGAESSAVCCGIISRHKRFLSMH